MADILVFGGRGMLGRYVASYMSEHGHSIVAPTRDDLDISDVAQWPKIDTLIQGADLVVNCAGSIKPVADRQSFEKTYLINTAFPQYLAKRCTEQDRTIKPTRMVHITSDCVFSGKKGSYVETDVHDVWDDYGLSKSLGENMDVCNIRTSIIGEEGPGRSRSLLEWAKSQKGQKVSGYTNHVWSGVTCLELAKVINKMWEQALFWQGVGHVFSQPVDKCSLLSKISEAFGLELEIEPKGAASACNRSLKTAWAHEKYTDLLRGIPDIDTQLKEMVEWRAVYDRSPNL